MGGMAPPGFHGGGMGTWHFLKLDMPLFDGTDHDGWILRVERYFTFYKLTEADMLEVMVVAFEGDALPTNQETIVSEYRKRFIETAAPLDRVSEAVLLGQFINGLKDDIKAEVRLLNLVSLDHAMEVAVRLEEKCQVVSTKKQKWGSSKMGIVSTISSKGSYSSPYSAMEIHASPTAVIKSWSTGVEESQASVYSPKPSVNAGVSHKPMGEVRRLTEKELQEKKAKGLCFRCDDKWSIGHRCRKKELSVLLLGDEEEYDDGGLGTELPLPLLEELTTEVSLNSVIGLSNPKTMKVLEKIGEAGVVVRVDPGATHNFISLKVVEQLSISLSASGNFAVSLGNGEAIRGKGVCKAVTMKLNNGVAVVDGFLPLTLGKSNVILGIKWLETLGPVVTYWKTQEMCFDVKGKNGFMVECNMLESDKLNSDSWEDKLSKISRQLETTVRQFETVFQGPIGLPPKRGHKHAITLKQGSNLVGIRLYQYPQCHKNEIERLIQVMLAAGLIKPSSSAFSSPPLTNQLKGDNFRWDEGATKAFDILKSAMISPPVFAIPNFQKQFVVEEMLRLQEIEHHNSAANQKGLAGRGKEHKGFHVIEDVLMYKGRRAIPKNSKFVPVLLRKYHDSTMGGHAGEFKTYIRLTGDWFWVGMRQDITRHVQQYGVCQQNKVLQKSPARLLQPLPIPSGVWQDITLDFIDGLPTSRGVNSVLVVVDRLSKYAYFLGLKHLYYAVTVAEVFLKEIVRLHGFPTSIVSGRDRIFLSTFWKELFRIQGT
ncbi:uncharacterized protein LOC141686775 [Apium graveolens]|uniref:uncharacterized protein LOC141686775 n=1 Tax=Apium graveolens TaxID=4045 RepID=UPI003D7BE080